jgi:hypothetical protein
VTDPCLTCPLARCAGSCACSVSGHPTYHHAADGYCPHPAGPRFGTGAVPASWPPPPTPAKPPDRTPANWSPEFAAGRNLIGSHRQPPRFTVCTFSTNDFAPLADLTAAVNKRWADRHGYGFLNAVGQFAPDCPASWNRMPWYIALCDILPPGSLVFHIDADAVVTNPDFKLESLVGADDYGPDDPNGWDVLFPIDHVGRHCGVWMWRVGPKVKELFQRAYDRRHVEKDWNYWEQGAIVRELGELRDPNMAEAWGQRAGVRERFVAKYAVNCWNNWHTADWEPGSNVYHHVGETMELKLRGVETVLSAAERGERIAPFDNPMVRKNWGLEPFDAPAKAPRPLITRPPEPIPADYDPEAERIELRRGGCGCSPPPPND